MSPRVGILHCENRMVELNDLGIMNSRARAEFPDSILGLPRNNKINLQMRGPRRPAFEFLLTRKFSDLLNVDILSRIQIFGSRFAQG